MFRVRVPAAALVRCLPTAAWLLALGVAGPAQADIISDEEAGCRGKNEGDACEAAGKAGTCAKSTCGRNDYSGGPPPKHVSVECLLCQVGGAAKDAAPSPDTPAKTDTPAKADTPAKTDTPAKADTPAKTDTPKGCSSGGVDDGPWLLVSVLAGLGLVGLARRRPSGTRA